MKCQTLVLLKQSGDLTGGTERSTPGVRCVGGFPRRLSSPQKGAQTNEHVVGMPRGAKLCFLRTGRGVEQTHLSVDPILACRTALTVR
jgi:hypothetical protein